MAARLAVLVSGSGTNLQAILDATRDGWFRPEIVLVVSNKPGVKALERAEIAGIPSVVVDHRAFGSREEFEAEVQRVLEAHHVTFVALAGFMRILTAGFVSKWQGRLVNLHPSLLPEFPGAHAIRDALLAGASRTGVTVHFVDAGVDTGPVIAQVEVPILPGDSEETLAARVHEVEHRVFPKAIDSVAS